MPTQCTGEKGSLGQGGRTHGAGGWFGRSGSRVLHGMQHIRAGRRCGGTPARKTDRGLVAGTPQRYCFPPTGQTRSGVDLRLDLRVRQSGQPQTGTRPLEGGNGTCTSAMGCWANGRALDHRHNFTLDLTLPEASLIKLDRRRRFTSAAPATRSSFIRSRRCASRLPKLWYTLSRRQASPATEFPAAPCAKQVGATWVPAVYCQGNRLIASFGGQVPAAIAEIANHRGRPVLASQLVGRRWHGIVRIGA